MLSVGPCGRVKSGTTSIRLRFEPFHAKGSVWQQSDPKRLFRVRAHVESDIVNMSFVKNSQAACLRRKIDADLSCEVRLVRYWRIKCVSFDPYAE